MGTSKKVQEQNHSGGQRSKASQFNAVIHDRSVRLHVIQSEISLQQGLGTAKAGVTPMARVLALDQLLVSITLL